jgi:predicted DNA-binding protein
MRMSAEESTRLEYLAEHYGLNAAGVLRMLVKGDFDRLHRETQAPAAPAPKPRKR